MIHLLANWKEDILAAVTDANAFVIKGQILTIAATVLHHILEEYHLEDDKAENIILIFKLWKIRSWQMEYFVGDTEVHLSQRHLEIIDTL